MTTNKRTVAELARLVKLCGEELGALAAAMEEEGTAAVDWRGEWSTYTLEAYAAIYKQWLADGGL